MTRLHTSLGMRSQGDFDSMWSTLEQQDAGVAALARQPLACLYAPTASEVACVEDDGGYRLSIDFPGMHMDDLSLNLRGQTLTIHGERTENTAEASASHGRPYRAFARRFVLKTPVELDGMSTTYADGMLTVYLPEAAERPVAQPAMQIA